MEGISRRTLDAKAHSSYRFGVLINHKAGGPREIGRRVAEIAEELLQNDVTVMLTRPQGAGGAWISCLLNPVSLLQLRLDKSRHVSMLADGDQFDVSQPDILRGVQIIARRLIDREELIGLGARNKVILSANSTLDVQRQIDEMYHALFMRKIRLTNDLGLDLSDVPSSYAMYGDPMPGFYALNLGHKNYPRFYRAVYEAAIQSNLTGYVGDSYCVLRAAALTKTVESIYLPILGNPQGSFGYDTIYRRCVEIGKTDVGRRFAITVRSHQSQNILGRFFRDEEVSRVRATMLSGLSEGSAAKRTKLRR